MTLREIFERAVATGKDFRKPWAEYPAIRDGVEVWLPLEKMTADEHQAAAAEMTALLRRRLKVEGVQPLDAKRIAADSCQVFEQAAMLLSSNVIAGIFRRDPKLATALEKTLAAGARITCTYVGIPDAFIEIGARGTNGKTLPIATIAIDRATIQ